MAEPLICPDCGHTISKSGRRCPNCNRYLWSPGRKLFAVVFVGIILFIVIAALI